MFHKTASLKIGRTRLMPVIVGKRPSPIELLVRAAFFPSFLATAAAYRVPSRLLDACVMVSALAESRQSPCSDIRIDHRIIRDVNRRLTPLSMFGHRIFGIPFLVDAVASSLFRRKR